jgi:hypothetical protein
MVKVRWPDGVKMRALVQVPKKEIEQMALKEGRKQPEGKQSS